MEKQGPMNESTIKIRPMKADDFDAAVGIDESVFKAPGMAYYEHRY
jgi:hypothetical protein